MKHLHLLPLLLLLTACPPKEPNLSPPQLEIPVDQLDFKENQTGTFTLKNAGQQRLTWNVSNLETLTWVKTFSFSSGIIEGGQDVQITITLDRSKLKPGQNTSPIEIKSTPNNKVSTLSISAFLAAKPTLTMIAADLTQKTGTTIRAKATITELGSSDVTEHGHVWGTTATPTVDDGSSQKSRLGALDKPKSVFSNVSGLRPNTTYYIRAYAQNQEGIAYSTILSFTTLSVRPTVTMKAADLTQKTSTTIRAKATVTELGSSNITEHGHVWGTTATPTLDDGSSQKSTLGALDKPESAFSNLSGLSPNTTYYIRAYAQNQEGIAYSAILRFTTLKTTDVPRKPVLTLTAADLSEKTGTSIRAKATVTELGSSNITEHGHVWGTTAAPTLEDGSSQKSTLGGLDKPESVLSNVSGLSPNTTYYIRAYAQNQEEIGYSSVVSFTTLDGLTGFDPFYKDQWYLENTGQYGGKVGIDVNVKGVWQQGYLGTGISIGILDEPIDHTHPDLKDNLTSDRVKDFANKDCDSHGTNVAGIIAARDNNVGIQGIAPRAKLFSYGVLTGGGANDKAFFDNIARAYQSSEHTEIAVYNASIGPGEGSYIIPYKPIIDAFDKVTRDGFNGLGSSLVFSAGNVGQVGSSTNNFILNHYAVIGVNSVRMTGQIINEFGGTQGSNLWLIAPTGFQLRGDTVITTDNVGDCGKKGDYEYVFGSTSGAAPNGDRCDCPCQTG